MGIGRPPYLPCRELIGESPGETLELAEEMAARDALRCVLLSFAVENENENEVLFKESSPDQRECCSTSMGKASPFFVKTSISHLPQMNLFLLSRATNHIPFIAICKVEPSLLSFRRNLLQ